MDSLKTPFNKVSKEQEKGGKPSNSDELLTVHKATASASQITLFSGRRRSLSQPDLAKIDASQNSSIAKINSEKGSKISVKSKADTPKTSVVSLKTEKRAVVAEMVKGYEVTPRISTFKLTEVPPQIQSAPPNSSYSSIISFETDKMQTNYRKKAAMNRLTVDMSSNASFNSSSLLRNPEYRRTIAVMDANLNIKKFSSASSTPPPAISLPVPNNTSQTIANPRAVSRATTMPEKKLSTLTSVKFGSFEEPSFVSVDILEDVKTKESPVNTPPFKVFRANIPSFLKALLFISVVASTAFLSLLSLYSLPQYAFIPTLLLIFAIVSNVLFFSLDIPNSSILIKELYSSYPLLISALVGLFFAQILSGIVSSINLISSWVPFILFLSAGCSAILIILEIFALNMSFAMVKSLRTTYTDQLDGILKLCIAIRKKHSGVKLDVYDTFFSRILFSELSLGNDRITRKLVSPYTVNESVFKSLNLYDNADITELELTECIEHIIQKSQYEIEEKRSVYFCCKKTHKVFFQFGLFCSFIVMAVGILGVPFGLPFFFFGLVASPILIRPVLTAIENGRIISTRNWHIGDLIQLDEPARLTGFEFNQVHLKTYNQKVILKKYPLQEICIIDHISKKYNIQGTFNKDEQYLIFKGLTKKTHRFVKAINIELVSNNKTTIILDFKRNPRNCLAAIEEVLKKYELPFEHVELEL